MVHARNQSVRERVRREQDRPRFFMGDSERGDDRDDSVPGALSLDRRTQKVRKGRSKV